MSETSAHKWLKKSVFHSSDRFSRIENIVGDGTPDVNCCIQGNEFWLETKSPREPKKPGTPLFGSNHKFSQEQKNWFLAQRNAKGKGGLFIYTDKNIFLVKQEFVDCINEMTVDEIRSAALWFSTKPCGKYSCDCLRIAFMGL